MFAKITESAWGIFSQFAPSAALIFASLNPKACDPSDDGVTGLAPTGLVLRRQWLAL
jgi:hypothetical protein